MLQFGISRRISRLQSPDPLHNYTSSRLAGYRFRIVNHRFRVVNRRHLPIYRFLIANVCFLSSMAASTLLSAANTAPSVDLRNIELRGAA